MFNDLFFVGKIMESSDKLSLPKKCRDFSSELYSFFSQSKLTANISDFIDEVLYATCSDFQL